MASLRDLEALLHDGAVDGPEAPGWTSTLQQECLYYLNTYGTHLALISFYMRHDCMTEALTYLLSRVRILPPCISESAYIGFILIFFPPDVMLIARYKVQLLLLPMAGMPRGGVPGGFAAALSGAGTPWCPPSHAGEAGSHPGGMQPLPHCLLPVPAATEILQHPLPASAVHDGEKRLDWNPRALFGHV